MAEYSNLLILVAVVIAFIAGYSIVSFLVRFVRKTVKDLQIPPLNDKSEPTNDECRTIAKKEMDANNEK